MKAIPKAAKCLKANVKDSLVFVQQPKLFDSELGTEDTPYDATESGPLCAQLGLKQETLDHYLVSVPFKFATSEVKG